MYDDFEELRRFYRARSIVASARVRAQVKEVGGHMAPAIRVCQIGSRAGRRGVQ